METRPHDPVPEVMLLGSHRYVSLAAFWQERQAKEGLRAALRAILDLTAREQGPASAALEEIARLAEEAIRPSSAAPEAASAQA